jgi:hypothetical protein
MLPSLAPPHSSEETWRVVLLWRQRTGSGLSLARITLSVRMRGEKG